MNEMSFTGTRLRLSFIHDRSNARTYVRPSYGALAKRSRRRKDTFWVCLIGKGYPAPRQKFRWCTERMKIKPADALIRETIRKNGSAILVLGTRKAESQNRKSP